MLVTSKSDLTADLIVLSLNRHGLPFIRLNQEDYPSRLRITWPGGEAAAEIGADCDRIDCRDVRSAWFRAPALPPDAASRGGTDFFLRERAAFLSGFWEVMPWFWINRPSAVCRAEHKLWQLALAGAHGFRVPKTLISNDAAAVRSFVAAQESIVKPLSGGSFIEAGRTFDIHTSPVRIDDLADEPVQSAPAIYQERIAGRFDLRVTVVGDRLFASRILRSGPDRASPDWRAADPADVSYEPHRLSPSLAAACIAFTRACGLVFGALDFIVTPEGEHVFLEINPSGQWGWIEDATGAPITETIVDCLARGAI